MRLHDTNSQQKQRLFADALEPRLCLSIVTFVEQPVIFDLLPLENSAVVTSIGIADIDGDDVDDVLVGMENGDPSLIWLKAVDNGHFESPQPIGQLVSVGHMMASDLDNDGDTDLLVAARPSLVWYENVGSGTFGEPQTITTEALATGIHIADVDGDLDVDVLLTRSSAAKWFENLDANGLFGAEHIITDFPGAWDIETGDFDGE